MPYDENLANRIRAVLSGDTRFTERKMFGGLAFMLSGNMACGVLGDTLMARVGPDAYAECLVLPHASEMDFTGRPMQGMVYVANEGVQSMTDLDAWLQRCSAFAGSLPAK